MIKTKIDGVAEWKAAGGRSINGPSTISVFRRRLTTTEPPMIRVVRTAWRAIGRSIDAGDISGTTAPEPIARAVEATYNAFGEYVATYLIGTLHAAGRHMKAEAGKADWGGGADPVNVALGDIADGWVWYGGIGALRDWVQNRSGTLIKHLKAKDLETIRKILEAGMFGVPPRTVDVIAREIRAHIGILPQQYDVLVRMREAMAADGATPAQIERAVTRYRRLQLNRRARNIARTETAEAWNRGMIESVRSMRRQGDVAGVWKTWWTADDERTCPTCNPLHLQQAKLEQEFSGGYMHPPAHPSCRCTVRYFEPELVGF